MSMGMHRFWKRFTVFIAQCRSGERVLDLAGGTGDLAALMAKQVGSSGQVILSDINNAMLVRGRDRLLDRGLSETLTYVQANAESLPFPDNSVDCVTIGFGLRNVTDKSTALAEMYRVLAPGGRLLVLEFSQPRWPGLRPLYDLYSFQVLPRMGRWIAKDADSYQYLAESIRMHPDQETLLGMMTEVGFHNGQFFNLSGGIVAVHRGYKV